jgi:hypothetical protein
MVTCVVSVPAPVLAVTSCPHRGSTGGFRMKPSIWFDRYRAVVSAFDR